MNEGGAGREIQGRAGVSGRQVVTCMFALLCLGAIAGYGYWRFVFYPTTPQYALGVFLDAVRKRDYPTAYGRMYLTAPLKLVIPSARALERIGENAGGIIPRLKDYRLGRVERTAEGATVQAVLVTESADSETGSDKTDATEVAVEMRQEDGKWKVDASWAMGETVKRGGAELLRSLFN